MRWSIGDALDRLAGESVVDDLNAIAKDPYCGRDRQLVVSAPATSAKTCTRSRRRSRTLT